MACGDCTEFLVQGSGTVGSGSALAWEKVINFFDSDNIPLTVRSAEVLTKNGSPLVDTTPSWFDYVTSAQSLLIDGVITYQLTVTIQIDAVVAGEGTYNIRVCARVVDDSKAQVCCSFNVCITASQAGLVIGDLYIGGTLLSPALNRTLWTIAIPDLGDPAVNPMTKIGDWSVASCGWSTSNNPSPIHFHPTLGFILLVSSGCWSVDKDDFISCPVISVPEGANNIKAAQFDWIRDRVYYLTSGTPSELRYTKRDGTGDTLLTTFAIFPFGLERMLEYDDTTDLIYCASGAGDVFQINPVTGGSTTVISGITATGASEIITLDKEHQEVLEGSSGVANGIRRWSIATGLNTDIIVGGGVISPRWHVDQQRYYWFNNGDEIKRCDYTGGNIEVAGKKPGSGIFDMIILAGFETGS